MDEEKLDKWLDRELNGQPTKDNRRIEVVENKPTVLVLSSGSIYGMAQLGYLQRYHTNGLLDDISLYVGTSIGSIICFLLSIGYSPYELYLFAEKNKIDQLIEPNFQFLHLIRFYGFLSFDKVNELIEELTLKKMEAIPSLTELHEYTGKEVVFVTYNLTKKSTEYVSYKTHPDISCLDAIRMSCNIPIIFDAFTYNDQMYIDGAVADPFPIAWTTSYIEIGVTYRLLAIQICFENDEKMPTSLFAYIKDILSILYCARTRQANGEAKLIEELSDKCKIVDIPAGKSGKSLAALFNLGYYLDRGN